MNCKIYFFKDMKNKILYFADCHIYGGSDRNIINLLNYMAEQSGSEVLFAFKQNDPPIEIAAQNSTSVK